jgi:hypothetical protein
MKFFAAIAAFVAVAAAQYSAAPVEESCSAVVTVTVTEYVFPALYPNPVPTQY